jgi:hypothetical protein
MLHPAQLDFADNVPAGGMGFKWDDGAGRVSENMLIPG